MLFGQHDGPAEIGEGDALSCTACSEVAIANLDVATSLREQPFPEMLKYFVDATPQFCLGDFLHIAGSGRGAQFFDQFFWQIIGLTLNESCYTKESERFHRRHSITYYVCIIRYI